MTTDITSWDGLGGWKGPESAELLPKYGHPSLPFGPSSFMQEDLTTQWDLGLALWLSGGHLFSTTHLSMLSTAKQSQQKAESKISPDQNAIWTPRLQQTPKPFCCSAQARGEKP